MIFRREYSQLRLLLAAAVLGLAGCSDPAPEMTPVDQARQLLSEGEGLAAEVKLRDIMASGTDQSELAAYLGEAELMQGQLAEARQWLGKGKFSKDTSGHGYHMLGRLEMAEGKLPDAGKAFDKALADNDGSAELWVDIGRLRYRGGEQLQAVKASIHAVELSPENPVALQFRAQLVRDSEGMDAALPWFEQALEQNPENTALLYEYAATLGELGRAREMLVEVRKIARLDPANRRIYFLQAVLAARAGKFELARGLLLRAGSVMQELPAGMLLSGIIDIENGNYASAAQTLEQLAAQQPENPTVTHMLARALSLGGNDRELVYRYGEAVSQPNASAYLRALVARSYEAIGDRDKAAVLIDNAVQPFKVGLVPVKGSATLDVAEIRGADTGTDLLQLVRARIEAGNASMAVATTEQFLTRYPGSYDGLSLAGDANFAAGNYRTAIDRYEQASSIRRPWSLAQKLIKSLRLAKRNDEAAVLLTTYFIGDPSNTEAALSLAREAFTRDDAEAAAIFADHALANGGRRNPALLGLRAQIALELGDTDFALEMAERAYRIQPLGYETTRNLAEVYRNVDGMEKFALVLDAKLKRMTP